MSTSYFCTKCGTRIVGTSFKIRGKNVCGACYAEEMKVLEDIEDQKKDLYKYICSLFSLKECPIQYIDDINRLVKDGYKVSGIRATIQYYFQIMGNQSNTINIPFIGKIIELNYLKAKQYFEEVKKVQEENEKVDLNIPPKIVYINPQKNKRKKTVKYKMEDL